ncbi:Alpha/beta hydrolase fold-1 [Macrophomina phaseolina]|uniref:Alpha/beta hydrolase fold-1 n=1 Tax=Macrophomina phaseolina TaxID=35725 RepID=A0ABQ8FXT8_9PEZI|nr:Alpha/beta hydrolase fold-1 [Macrophomina phaseolina]
MAAESKPTILLVPGAWQPSDAFDPLRQLLAQRGYESVAVDHPSVGGEPADQTLDTDVASLRSTLTRLIDNEAKEVVVLLHSYGGVVGSCASEGFGAKQRASEGKKGGILEIIYLSAFALPKGKSLLDMLGGQPLPWMRLEGSKVFVDLPPATGFPDLSPSEQETWSARLTHTAAAVFTGPSTYEPWHDIPCMYFICDGDTLIIPPIQEAMAQSLGATIRRNTGAHSAFLSVPDQVFEGIEAAVREGREKSNV